MPSSPRSPEDPHAEASAPVRPARPAGDAGEAIARDGTGEPAGGSRFGGAGESAGESRFDGVASAVAAFHAAFGLPRSGTPTADVPDDLAALRVRLLAEEVEEFAAATTDRDLVGIADALADVVYVAYGSALTYGIDLDAVLAEVHRSNMSKLDADGRALLREDGKVLKSSRYSPPDVAAVLRGRSRVPSSPGEPDIGSGNGVRHRDHGSPA